MLILIQNYLDSTTVTEYQEIEEALEIFNNTEYALTGGIFSQSPNELARLDWFFDCGNVYINRNITGARVGIEPFGGYKASITGVKGRWRYLLGFISHKHRTKSSMDTI